MASGSALASASIGRPLARLLVPECTERERADPRVRVGAQVVRGREDDGGVARGGRGVAVEEAHEAPRQPRIADRVEGLDRLRPDLGVDRAQAAADEAARLAGTEQGERAQEARDDRSRPTAGDVPEEGGARDGRCLGEKRGAPAQRRGSGDLPIGPLDEPVPGGDLMADERLEGRILLDRRAIGEHPQRGLDAAGPRADGRGGREAHLVGGVVERVEIDREAVGRMGGRRSKRCGAHLRSGIEPQPGHGLGQDRHREARDRIEPGRAAGWSIVADERGDDRLGPIDVAVVTQRDRDLATDERARVGRRWREGIGEVACGVDLRPAREAAHGGDPDVGVRVGQGPVQRGQRDIGAPVRQPADGREAHGRVLVLRQDDERRVRFGVGEADEELGREQPLGGPLGTDRVSQRGPDTGLVGERREAGTTGQDLLGEPAPERGDECLSVRATDQEHDDEAGRRGHEADDEHGFERVAAHDDEGDAREERSELPGHAVDECHDRPAACRRDDAEERAPRGVRDPTLGDLLREADRDSGRQREAHDPRPESEQVDERQDDGRGRDAEPAVHAVGEQDADEERCAGHARREQRQRDDEAILAAELLAHRGHEREREAEHEDREQDVGERDPAHERGPGDVPSARRERGRHRHPCVAGLAPRPQPWADAADEQPGDREREGFGEDELLGPARCAG